MSDLLKMEYNINFLRIRFILEYGCEILRVVEEILGVDSCWKFFFKKLFFFKNVVIYRFFVLYGIILYLCIYLKSKCINNLIRK